MYGSSLLCALVFVASVLSSNAQENDTGRVRISEVNLYTGFTTYRAEILTLEEAKIFAPGSVLLAQDFSGFSSSSGWSTYTSTNLHGSVGLTFNSKPNMRLRMGFNYRGITGFYGSNNREDRYTFDTLTSAQTGTQYVLDSVVSRNASWHQTAEHISLDASLIFSTNAEARWSFYGGIGGTIGMAINVGTMISYYETYQTPLGLQQVNYSFTSEHEEYRNSGYLVSSVYSPLGIDFRIGQKREFLKMVHLFYEFRPTVFVASIPELDRTSIRLNLTHGLGVKVAW